MARLNLRLHEYIHLLEGALSFPDIHCKAHQRNVKFALRDPDLV